MILWKEVEVRILAIFITSNCFCIAALAKGNTDSILYLIGMVMLVLYNSMTIASVLRRWTR